MRPTVEELYKKYDKIAEAQPKFFAHLYFTDEEFLELGDTCSSMEEINEQTSLPAPAILARFRKLALNGYATPSYITILNDKPIQAVKNRLKKERIRNEVPNGEFMETARKCGTIYHLSLKTGLSRRYLYDRLKMLHRKGYVIPKWYRPQKNK